MRKLASIQRVAEIRPIEGADAIEHFRINGWWVVDRKGAHRVGDLVVYCEIDSWIPHELCPFLSKGQEPREYNGVKGERLRTIKLRGAVSQGLLLPMATVFAWDEETQRWEYLNHPETGSEMSDPVEIEGGVEFSLTFIRVFADEGDDLTEYLGIQKWEAPIPAQLAGKAKGNFPSWGRKTDQERCQNLWDEIQQHIDNDTKFEVTVKLDGSSASYGVSPYGEYVVCSRNLSLETEQEGNTFVDAGRKNNLETKLKELGRPLMISGELCGPGIQKNQEGLKDHQLFVFDIYDPLTMSYLPCSERFEIVNKLELQHVPVIHQGVALGELGIQTLNDLLNFAEGPSLNSNQREGVVFKAVDGSFSFKAISNKWLIKNE
jgi:RNA ligase (TIGR02306 family)